MEFHYATPLQGIRRRGGTVQVDANLPLPLAAALDLEPGETVIWKVLDRTHWLWVRWPERQQLQGQAAPRRKRSRRSPSLAPYLVEDLAPVIVPTSVSPKNAQGQHLLEVFHLPPRPRHLEPGLHHVTMGALDRARTDGQTCRPSTLVIQVIRMVDEIAVAGANRGLGVRNAGRFHEGLETSHHLRPAIRFQPVLLFFPPEILVLARHDFGGRGQVIAPVGKIDQIGGERSKLLLHLVDNPGSSIPQTMDLRWVARSRRQGAFPQALARFLHAPHRRAKDRCHRARVLHQTEASFFPAQLAGFPPILGRFTRPRRGRFHHRHHAPVHLGDQDRHSRMLGPRAPRFLLRSHGFPVFFGQGPNRADRYVDPVVLFELHRCSSKGIIRPQIDDGSLQRLRALPTLHFRRFGKGANLRPPSAAGEDLLFYFDSS